MILKLAEIFNDPVITESIIQGCEVFEYSSTFSTDGFGVIQGTTNAFEGTLSFRKGFVEEKRPS